MAELKKIIVDGVEHTLPEGGGGSAQVFVDVDSLPTENINSDVIYRLLRMCGIINDMLQTNTTVHIVDTLPTTGENCTDGSNITVVYYNKSDDSVYGYLDATFGAAFGVPAGWYPAANLLQLADVPYGGIVDSTVGLESGKYYFVKEYDFYIYKGKWIKLDNDIVFQGEGVSSVVMNDLGNIASGDFSHAEGESTTASGRTSHAEGVDTTVSGDYSHAEGIGTTASGGYGSHAEGHGSTASGEHSHAEGYHTTASGEASHAEGGGGTYTIAHTFTRTSTQRQYTSISTLKFGVVLTDRNGTYATIISVSGTESPYTYTLDKDFVTTEGETVTLYQASGVASGYCSHAEGSSTTASGTDSHAEGNGTMASGEASHAEGSHTTASSSYSHAEGYATTASGMYSHAEGDFTTASGENSHVEGSYTIASGEHQHVQGKYNIEDSSSKYAHIVGNGTSSSALSNAHTLDWSGNAWFAGNVRVGGTSWDDATELGSGSGGGSSANMFEDVSILPDSPDSQKIYRVSELELMMYTTGVLISFNDTISSQGGKIVLIEVDELPLSPITFMNTTNMVVTGYVLNNSVYGYNNGWLSNTELFTTYELGVGYGGVVTDNVNLDTLTDDYIYLYYNQSKYFNINEDSTYEFSRVSKKLYVTITGSYKNNGALTDVVITGGGLPTHLLSDSVINTKFSADLSIGNLIQYKNIPVSLQLTLASGALFVQYYNFIVESYSTTDRMVFSYDVLNSKVYIKGVGEDNSMSNEVEIKIYGVD